MELAPTRGVLAPPSTTGGVALHGQTSSKTSRAGLAIFGHHRVIP